eukprot:125008-Pyramimonas_sp.AAC.1
MTASGGYSWHRGARILSLLRHVSRVRGPRSAQRMSPDMLVSSSKSTWKSSGDKRVRGRVSRKYKSRRGW